MKRHEVKLPADVLCPPGSQGLTVVKLASITDGLSRILAGSYAEMGCGVEAGVSTLASCHDRE